MAYAIRVKFFNSFWMKKVVPKAEGDALPAVGDCGTVNIQWPQPSDEYPLSLWPGLPWNPTGYPTFPWNNAAINANPNEAIGERRQWFIEEAVIRGGFNNTRASLGVKAYLAEDDEAVQQHRASSLIYSGVYNSRTGVNNTNVFSIGEDISKSVNPSYGSIQKLFAENTNLNIFQENKVQKALIDKDAVYTAEGSPMQTQSNVVIGQIVPYLGEYGISNNPESFATYGFQKYFADANRGVICRLSRDGITEISEYGMRDYFRDALSVINPFDSLITLQYPMTFGFNPGNLFQFDAGDCGCCSIEPGMAVWIQDSTNTWVDTGAYVVDTRGESCQTTISKYLDFTDYGLAAWPVNGFQLKRYISDKIVGGWDIHNRCYTTSIQPTTIQNGCVVETGYSTVNFDEAINGWVSFYDYKPSMMCSLKSAFFSSNNYQLWQHYFEDPADNTRGIFYDQEYKPSQIRFIFNPNASIVKSFQTINYEGSNGWEVLRYYSDPTEFNQDPYPINPPTNPLTFTPDWQAYEDQTAEVASYEGGVYVDNAYIGSDGLTYRSGFYRKENRYVANLVSASLPRAGEVVFWDGDSNTAAPISGIKGYYVTVDLQTDDVTDKGGLKELFAVSSTFVTSSI